MNGNEIQFIAYYRAPSAGTEDVQQAQYWQFTQKFNFHSWPSEILLGPSFKKMTEESALNVFYKQLNRITNMFLGKYN